MHKENTRIPMLLFSLFAIGALVRLFTNNLLISTDLIYASGHRQVYPGTRTPEDTVKSFYLFIDNGLYDKAWEISLEPDWTGGMCSISYLDAVKSDPSLFAGWTKKEDFEERLKKELGITGLSITLNDIQTHRLKAKGAKCIDSELVEMVTDHHELKDIYTIKATGKMLGACSIFKWEKDLVVLNINEKYKVLLNGTKQKNSFFYNSWFSNLEHIGNLRGDDS